MKKDSMKYNLSRFHSYLWLRAFLRIKVRYKRFEFRSVAFLAILYLVLSLGIFILPNDILTRYPFLTYLTDFMDFMDFIPAVSLLESKSFAPELCTFYASYMLVFGFGLLVWGVKMTLRDAIYSSMRPYSEKYTRWYKMIAGFVNPPRTYPLITAWFCCSFMGYECLAGNTLGFNKKEHFSEYFVDSGFELMFNMLWFQGYITIFMLGYVIVATILVIDFRIRNKLKGIR